MKKIKIGKKQPDDALSSTMCIDLSPTAKSPRKASEAGRSGGGTRRKTPVVRVPRTRPHNHDEARRYRHLLESIYDGALITNRNGHISDANPRACEFFQYRESELLSRNVLDLICGGDKALLETLREQIEGRRFVLIQAYCMRKDQSQFPAEIAVSLLRFSEMQICFFIRDITRRHQTEEMLRTEHNAIQNAGAGIALTDRDGRLEQVNPAMAAMWGYPQVKDLIGKSVYDLWRNRSVAEEMTRLVLAGQESWSGEIAARHANGSIFFVQVSAACNRDADGELVGIVFSFVDISDRKRAEQALRRAEAHEAMLASVGAACHHLGQPATVILTNLELMKRMPEMQSGKAKEILDMNIEAAELLRGILLKLNMPDAFRLTPYIGNSSAKILDIDNAMEE